MGSESSSEVGAIHQVEQVSEVSEQGTHHLWQAKKSLKTAASLLLRSNPRASAPSRFFDVRTPMSDGSTRAEN